MIVDIYPFAKEGPFIQGGDENYFFEQKFRNFSSSLLKY